MPSRGFQLDKGDFVVLKTAVTPNLTDGEAYTVQNKSSYRLHLAEDSRTLTEPDTELELKSQIVSSYNSAVVSMTAGQNVYVWMADNAEGTVSVVEVAD